MKHYVYQDAMDDTPYRKRSNLALVYSILSRLDDGETEEIGSVTGVRGPMSVSGLRSTINVVLADLGRETMQVVTAIIKPGLLRVTVFRNQKGAKK